MATAVDEPVASTLPSPDDKYRFVRGMFDRIAPRYDLMNRLMTFGLDQTWRKRALAIADLEPTDSVIDLACGTGDLAERAGLSGARVTGVDFSRVMLRGAQQRRVPAGFVQADGARLPFPDAGATVLVSGFALRNFVSLPEVFAECARVLAPGGRLVLLDVDRPRSRALAFLHGLYFDRVVPLLGALLSDAAAYRYLPQSTAYLPPRGELEGHLLDSGFGDVAHQSLLLGAVQILSAKRA